MNHSSTSLWRFILILGTLAMLGMVAGCILPAKWRRPDQSNPFQVRPLPIESFHLFDIGVTDMNGDGVLDMFTANHSARQSFLLGNGRGGWKEWPLEATGLSQSPAFPGLEDSDHTPQFTTPGLYLYWNDSRLVLNSHHLTSNPVRGQLIFFTPLTIESRGDFGAWTSSLVQTGKRTVVGFQANGNGQLILTPQPYPRVGSPIRLELADAAMTRRTFIGQERTSPPEPNILLDLKDRHGVIWLPAGDEETRVFITGGANLGLTDVLPSDRRAYEYFQMDGQRFRRLDGARWGLKKGGCAARQASFRDVNGDGWGDFYVTCVRQTANQLFLGSEEGRFTETAADLGLDMPDAGTFAWLDVDDDGRPDMIWAGEYGVSLYRNLGEHFRREQIEAPKVWAQHITLGDFDGDGDGDAFVASKDANLILINDDGALRYQAPESLGLPRASLTAHWVDVDNDGRMDLHAVPGGVFRQTADGRFQLATDMGLPPAPALENLRSARAVWFDADNDGYQELVTATQTLDKQWQVAYFQRRPGPNHWLEVLLHGPEGNEAAMGAKVIVQAEGIRRESRVGWSESSHYGQGHYRLYFGMGTQTMIDRLTILWPDGNEQTLTRIPADQVLDVFYPAP